MGRFSQILNNEKDDIEKDSFNLRENDGNNNNNKKDW